MSSDLKPYVAVYLRVFVHQLIDQKEEGRRNKKQMRERKRRAEKNHKKKEISQIKNFLIFLASFAHPLSSSLWPT